MKLYLHAVLFLLATSITSFGETSPATAGQRNGALDRPAILTGKILISTTKPLSNGIVLIFNKESGPPPSRDRYWRVPDIIVTTDAKGIFTASVPPGTYYLQAAQKKPDGEIGPPQESEFFYFHSDANDNPKPINAAAGSRVSLGTLIGGALFTPEMVKRSEGITAVEGVVTDQDNKPVPGALVFAHLNNTAVGRPVFISERTDSNGRYLLRVHEGTYYLSVRSVLGGGAPEAGEFQNVTKGFDPRMVTLTKGQRLKNITLVVTRFSGKGSTGVPKPDKKWKNLRDLQSQ